MMHGRLRSEKIDALVLSRRNVGEADRLVALLTRPYGLLRVFVNGVRKIPSRRGGHTEPLTQVTGLLSGTGHRYFLSAVETQDYFRALHHDHDAQQRAYLTVRSLLGFFEEGDVHSTLFDMVSASWELFPSLQGAKRDLLEMAVYWRLFATAGLQPNWRGCRDCATSLPASQAYVNAREGFWLCETCCYQRDSLFVLNPRQLTILRFVASYPDQALRLQLRLAEARALLLLVRRYGDCLMDLSGNYVTLESNATGG